MSSPVSTREALVCGLRTSRANWPLVALRWLQDAVAFALATAGMALPWIAVFGADVVEDLAPLVRARSVDALAVAVLDVSETILAAPEAVIAGLVGLVLSWTLALALYCWAQGGLWGVLAAAQSAAPTATRPAAVFRLGLFLRCGRRYFWRLFWLVNLYATAILGWLLLWLLPLVWMPRSSGGSVSWAAVLVGLALLLPVVLAAAATALWYALARAFLAVRDVTARTAGRLAGRELIRRPGPPILVSLLALAAVTATSGLLTPVSSASLALAGGGAATLWMWVMLQAGLFAVQGLVVAWSSTVHAGALVALVHGAPGAAQ